MNAHDTLDDWAPPDERINDLMILGLLVVDAVLLAILELVFVTFMIGAYPVPISALVALVTTPWLIRRAGELSEGTLGASGPILAWAVTICVLGLLGPGGDVMLPGTWPALLLVIAGLVPGAYVLGRVIKEKQG
ncbi:hypothetical protein [Pseudonocardia spinosispora]|uniref:hypothetical protein n=1 Tax=Pseudonocardia spinosispora TaxID=103441 RepID=UPI0003F651C9|nr:hypothetical protein [Pseudonocardia spinosispora]